MRKLSRAAATLLVAAAMSSGCTVDASALARLLANSGLSQTVAIRPATPDALGEPGVSEPGRPGTRPGLRRPVPTPPPQAARPEPMPLPPLPEPWVAPVPQPQRFQGALAFLPDQPVGPASLRALAALAELEAEFNLSTLTLLERPEIRQALGGGERAPWGDGNLVANGGGLIGDEGGSLVGDDGGGATAEGSAEGDAGLISNHGGVLISNNNGSAIVRLPARPAAGRRLAQVRQRDAALVVVGPIAQILIQVVRNDRAGGRREGRYDFPNRDGRARHLSYRLEGQALVLSWASEASPTAPAAKLERRVEYADGVWFHSVTGDLGGLSVSYSIENGRGGGGYLEGPEGYVGFTAVDPSQPVPDWTEPGYPEPYPGEEPGVEEGEEGDWAEDPEARPSYPPTPPPPSSPAPTPVPSVRPSPTPNPSASPSGL